MDSPFSTSDITVGIIASIGVLVLIVLFMYVVKQIIMRKD
jgi:hypothetical protein